MRIPGSQRALSERDVDQLADLLVAYHSDHEQEHGPISSCEEATCTEGRWAVSFLRECLDGQSADRFRFSVGSVEP